MAADSSVNVPVESDSLSVQIAAAPSRHPALYYSAQLENSHIPAHRDMNSFFGDPFTDTFNAYNVALFDSVREMIRYEKSLSVWSTIVTDIDSEVVRNTPLWITSIPSIDSCQISQMSLRTSSFARALSSRLSLRAIILWCTSILPKIERPGATGLKSCKILVPILPLETNSSPLLMRTYLNIQMPIILESFMAIRLMTLLPRWFLASTRAIQLAMPFLSKPILLRSICPMSLLLLIGIG